eukprot:Blabericola_migrator_1__4647@NODE_2460_length_2726_cov_145_685220_g1539_i0_p2_GENE_NODE_2460_length_2726_cov_145_685220_g1539_i0NODE_2460_length_2726_cov_145_685220_g1539_i0_p2_ORF_typecomplete_len311_score75_45PseudoU_synth_2/PF00849_22/1_5e24Glyco_transf_8/PF01501_20/0_12DUF2092/PF09865_9/6_8e03DUF2092/PF09865_9/0_3_NODE_2460_length_2726_cov_145_685220_g1539_i01471079
MSQTLELIDLIAALIYDDLNTSLSRETAKEISEKFIEYLTRERSDLLNDFEALKLGVKARLKQLVASRQYEEETEEADIEFLLNCPDYLSDVITILYEDNDTVIIGKPFDFRIDLGKNNEAISFENEPSVSQWWSRRYPNIPFRMCHQLDYATSGLMTLAKTQKQCARINKQFSNRTIDKTYLAIVVGSVRSLKSVGDSVQVAKGEGDKINVQFWIGKAESMSKQMAVVSKDTPGAQHCETDIEVLEHLEILHLGVPYQLSKLRLTPHTGRTHQLRVTTNALGHTILGDRKYGERDPAPWPRIHRDMPRM